jgi:hypothetical protein
MNLGSVGRNNHALADHGGAGGLQLGHLFNFHQAHAASALQRQVGVVAERRNFNAYALAGLNEQSSSRCLDRFTVYRDVY